MNYININGKITLAETAGIPVDNGAFRFGYGLFGTMLVEHGNIWLKEYHWERLFAGMQQIDLRLPPLMTAHWLEEQILQTVRKNKLDELCRVRLQVFGGGGGLFSVDSKPAAMVIECFPVEEEPHSLNENGLVVGIATGIDKSINSLSNLKSCNSLINVVAALQARQQKWNDILLRNTNGHIIESAIANIFWIKNNVVFTPPLGDGCVAGVMRRCIMEKIPVAEKSLTGDELLMADEVFLTNAIKKIRWVGSLGNVRYSNAGIKRIYGSL